MSFKKISINVLTFLMLFNQVSFVFVESAFAGSMDDNRTVDDMNLRQISENASRWYIKSTFNPSVQTANENNVGIMNDMGKTPGNPAEQNKELEKPELKMKKSNEQKQVVLDGIIEMGSETREYTRCEGSYRDVEVKHTIATYASGKLLEIKITWDTTEYWDYFYSGKHYPRVTYYHKEERYDAAGRMIAEYNGWPKRVNFGYSGWEYKYGDNGNIQQVAYVRNMYGFSLVEKYSFDTDGKPILLECEELESHGGKTFGAETWKFKYSNNGWQVVSYSFIGSLSWFVNCSSRQWARKEKMSKTNYFPSIFKLKTTNLDGKGNGVKVAPDSLKYAISRNREYNTSEDMIWHDKRSLEPLRVRSEQGTQNGGDAQVAAIINRLNANALPGDGDMVLITDAGNNPGLDQDMGAVINMIAAGQENIQPGTVDQLVAAIAANLKRTKLENSIMDAIKDKGEIYKYLDDRAVSEFESAILVIGTAEKIKDMVNQGSLLFLDNTVVKFTKNMDTAFERYASRTDGAYSCLAKLLGVSALNEELLSEGGFTRMSMVAMKRAKIGAAIEDMKAKDPAAFNGIKDRVSRIEQRVLKHQDVVCGSKVRKAVDSFNKQAAKVVGQIGQGGAFESDEDGWSASMTLKN